MEFRGVIACSGPLAAVQACGVAHIESARCLGRLLKALFDKAEQRLIGAAVRLRFANPELDGEIQ